MSVERVERGERLAKDGRKEATKHGRDDRAAARARKHDVMAHYSVLRLWFVVVAKAPLFRARRDSSSLLNVSLTQGGGREATETARAVARWREERRGGEEEEEDGGGGGRGERREEGRRGGGGARVTPRGRKMVVKMAPALPPSLPPI